MQFEVRRPGILFDHHGEVPRESVYSPQIQRFISGAVPVIVSSFKADQYPCILVCYYDRNLPEVLLDNVEFLPGRVYPKLVLRSDSDQHFFQSLVDANFDVRITRIEVNNTDGDLVQRVGLVVYEHQGAILDTDAAKKQAELLEQEPFPTISIEREERVLVCA